MDNIELNGIGQLAKACAAAMVEIQNPGFDKTNPHFRSKFASLAAVRNAVVPTFAKHGVAIFQNLTVVDGGVSCETILVHESGERMTFGPLVIFATKPDAHGYGSAATYARRYSLMAVANVVGDEDDDANAAVGNTMQHDPRGDLGKKVDTKLVNKWAKALIDQQDDQSRLVDVWNEIKEDHDLAVAVWGTLPKAIKDRVKDAQEAA